MISKDPDGGATEADGRASAPSANGPVGQVLAGPLFLKVNSIYKSKQQTIVLGKIFGLVQLYYRKNI